MFWLVLGGVAIVITILIAYINERGKGYDRVGSFLLAVGAGLFALFIAFGSLGVAAIIVEEVFAEEHREHQFDFDIVAAADGTETSGSFFLFGGSVNEEPMYFFYRQYNDESIRQGHIATDKSRIYEDTENEGYISVYKDSCVDFSFWFIGGCDGTEYEIHVPEGSVKKQFNFDLEK